MSDFYRFPAIAHLADFSEEQQLCQIRSEVREASNARDLRLIAKMTEGAVAWNRRNYGMELMDVIHATETALRMEFSLEEVAELRDAVEKKNRERGYYGEDN